MSSELDDPTQRPQTLQRPQGGVNPIAIVSLLAGVAAIVLLAAGIPTWIPLWFAAIGLFLAMISVLGSRPSAARWVSTIAIAVSVVPFVMMPFYITT
ncbi:hypothetical protein SCB71_05270 [Herbiconiux sp. KACC 21604]|uniref:hypothetical protein n=1 Tax=unclassified Herbiconiux TaxID=2618217 RepID=UPI0014928D20|nr:hypothetical protein [Herbiconiux sp. SALV-R1]QJU52752.1 hypothetical protein HL652_03250 [Herbiconiux sp. SALV-R1]WPO87656.1 hypothetical protein SCB71_05270 [Herbiconiux sp. KACC 21604]